MMLRSTMVVKIGQNFSVTVV